MAALAATTRRSAWQSRPEDRCHVDSARSYHPDIRVSSTSCLSCCAMRISRRLAPTSKPLVGDQPAHDLAHLQCRYVGGDAHLVAVPVGVDDLLHGLQNFLNAPVVALEDRP